MLNKFHTTSKTRQLGQGMTEYIIIVALIAIAAIATYTYFGSAIRNQTAGIAQEISGQQSTAAITDAQAAANSARTEAKNTKGLATYNNANANAGN